MKAICLVKNHIEASLVAQREINDAIAQTGGLENIEIIPKLINTYKNTRRRRKRKETQKT